MKLYPESFVEAQNAAKAPRFKFLMLGLVCGAIVPTIYLRQGLRINEKALENSSLIHVQNEIKAQQKNEPSVKSQDLGTVDSKGYRNNIPNRMVEPAGRLFKLRNDDEYRQMVRDTAIVMMSSAI